MKKEENNEIIEIENIRDLQQQQQFANTLFNFDKILKEILNTDKIEKISRVDEEDIDNIALMFYFGVRHTAILNISKIVNYPNLQLKYKDLRISSILEYVLINLSVKLSRNSESRIEIKEMITALIKSEAEKLVKELQQEQEQKKKGFLGGIFNK